MKNYFFDSNGLRFSVDYLKSMKNKVSQLSVVDLAEFVDQVTWCTVHDKLTFAIKHKFRVPEFNEISFPEFVTPTMLSNMNVSSLGNIAYVALYHKDSTVRLKALTFLQQLGIK